MMHRSIILEYYADGFTPVYEDFLLLSSNVCDMGRGSRYWVMYTGLGLLIDLGLLEKVAQKNTRGNQPRRNHS